LQYLVFIPRMTSAETALMKKLQRMTNTGCTTRLFESTFSRFNEQLKHINTGYLYLR
jgi:hypothetical protein